MNVRLTNKQLYDYCDVDRGELKLVRVGHYLWSMLRKSRKSHLPSEIEPLERAIETIVKLKREYRAELKIKRADRNRKLAERLRGKK